VALDAPDISEDALSACRPLGLAATDGLRFEYAFGQHPHAFEAALWAADPCSAMAPLTFSDPHSEGAVLSSLRRRVLRLLNPQFVHHHASAHARHA
jgi:hypothetical protein